ncbi:surface-adhesin E family protein [Sphingorhabdus sp.]|jgi:hypothetical protein|uniref:surface-adhesin E family protein n=1 Tax=Sphingorhabdus sp. TaxID=1902408 RepID=UPI0037C60A4E
MKHLLIAALLLPSVTIPSFAHSSAVAAQKSSGDPFNITYTVSKSGWRNLRKIDSSYRDIPAEYWYVCGARLILGLPKKEQLGDLYELVGRTPDKEFLGQKFFTLGLEVFSDSSLAGKRFMSSAVGACAATPDPAQPEQINAGYSSQASMADFYYLLPRDFQVKGQIRSFWLNGYPARNDKMKFRSGAITISDFDEAGQANLEPYVSGVDTWWVSETRSSIAKYEINCSSNEIRGLSYTKYGSDGSPNYSDSSPEKFEPIIPDTVADTWRELVCLIK